MWERLTDKGRKGKLGGRPFGSESLRLEEFRE